VAGSFGRYLPELELCCINALTLISCPQRCFQLTGKYVVNILILNGYKDVLRWKNIFELKINLVNNNLKFSRECQNPEYFKITEFLRIKDLLEPSFLI
jgi:hypothetical protein